MSFPQSPGFKDRSGSDTSQEGARLIRRRVKPLWALVLDALAAGPATAEQIGEEISEHFMIVRARLSELRAQGRVTATGTKGKGALGGKVNIWRLTTAVEQAAFLAADKPDAGPP